jgi:hypothetical protein
MSEHFKPTSTLPSIRKGDFMEEIDADTAMEEQTDPPVSMQETVATDTAPEETAPEETAVIQRPIQIFHQKPSSYHII